MSRRPTHSDSPVELPPIPAIPLEYQRDGAGPLIPIMRALAVLILVTGIVKFCMRIAEFLVWANDPSLQIYHYALYWPGQITGIALEIFEMVVGILCVTHRADFKLMRVWAWVAIILSIVSLVSYELYYANYATLNSGQYSLPAWYMFDMVIRATISVGMPIAVLIVYRIWSRLAEPLG